MRGVGARPQADDNSKSRTRFSGVSGQLQTSCAQTSYCVRTPAGARLPTVQFPLVTTDEFSGMVLFVSSMYS